MPSEHSSSSGLFDWAYKGVDHSFIGNGGPECRDFLSIRQRWIESLASCAIAAIALIYCLPRLTLPKSCPCFYRQLHEPLGKRFLVFLMSLVFGIELGFKFATRQMIWVANPCHIATMIQIFILLAPPGKTVMAIFRIHMHLLTGAPIAILFPVINTRLLPFESSIYFIQHFLMMVIPFYLLRHGDPFIAEALGDFKWALTSLGFMLIYHFVPLQLLAYVSQVNLNSMLCPAVSDPFRGQFYRLFGVGHQCVMILLMGKILVIIARVFRVLPLKNSVGELHRPCSCTPECCCRFTVCGSPDSNKEIHRLKEAGDHDSECNGTTKVAYNNLDENLHNKSCDCCDDCDHYSCSIYSGNINSEEFPSGWDGKAQFSAQQIYNETLMKKYKKTI